MSNAEDRILEVKVPQSDSQPPNTCNVRTYKDFVSRPTRDPLAQQKDIADLDTLFDQSKLILTSGENRTKIDIEDVQTTIEIMVREVLEQYWSSEPKKNSFVNTAIRRLTDKFNKLTLPDKERMLGQLAMFYEFYFPEIQLTSEAYIMPIVLQQFLHEMGSVVKLVERVNASTAITRDYMCLVDPKDLSETVTVNISQYEDSESKYQKIFCVNLVRVGKGKKADYGYCVTLFFDPQSKLMVPILTADTIQQGIISNFRNPEGVLPDSFKQIVDLSTIDRTKFKLAPFRDLLGISNLFIINEHSKTYVGSQMEVVGMPIY